MQFSLLYKYFIYLFGVIFPLIYLFENTNLLNLDLIPYTKIIRHTSVILISIFGALIYFKERKKNKNEILSLALFCTAILLFIELIKILYFSYFNTVGLYQSSKFLILLLFGYIVSKDDIFPTFSKLFVLSYIIFFIILFLILINQGENYVSNLYLRTRYVFGFQHPGMLAEGLLVLYLYMVFSKYNNYLFSNIIIFFLILIILLTGTRLVIFLTLMIFVPHFMIKVRFGISAKLYLYFIIIITMIIFLIVGFIIDIFTMNQYSSGRFLIWANTINEYLLNSSLFENLLGNNLLYSDIDDFYKISELKITYFDNGILEILLYHGLIGFFFIYKLLRSLIVNETNTFSDYKGPRITYIILFFCFFEAGLFAPGNFLCVMLTPLIFLNSIINSNRVHLN